MNDCACPVESRIREWELIDGEEVATGYYCGACGKPSSK